MQNHAYKCRIMRKSAQRFHFAKKAKNENCETGTLRNFAGISHVKGEMFGRSYLLFFLLFFQPLIIHFLTYVADKGCHLVRERLRGHFAVTAVRLEDL